MSKAIKKITKSVSKVAKSVYKHTLGDDGPLDGSMDILGLTVREEQQKQAERRTERRARIAERQARRQQANAVEQARAQVLQIQADADRQRILAEQQQQQNQAPDDTGAAHVDVAPVATDATTRRKKFHTPQVGGTGSGGVSIRL